MKVRSLMVSRLHGLGWDRKVTNAWLTVLLPTTQRWPMRTPVNTPVRKMKTTNQNRSSGPGSAKASPEGLSTSKSPPALWDMWKINQISLEPKWHQRAELELPSPTSPLPCKPFQLLLPQLRLFHPIKPSPAKQLSMWNQVSACVTSGNCYTNPGHSRPFQACPAVLRLPSILRSVATSRPHAWQSAASQV